MFRPLPTKVDLPALEREVMERWRDGKVFERSIEQTAGGTPWVFYEGPPTANGVPGVHHVPARVFKDLYPRYKTMRGYNVARRAGWDCHGLPVEVAVEKELGLSGKKDIESYGIAEFNARCRESVLRHVDAFEELTERMAYWTDLAGAYRTMDASYVEAVWWSLKVIFDEGLLFRDYRVTPYCPRCGTGLSDHELGQPGAYETIISPSIFVRFPVTTGPLAGEADLLIWTTTPWTLIADTMVAVHPDVTYVVAAKDDAGRDNTKSVVIAEPLVEKVLGEGWKVTRSMPGRELERTGYERPYGFVDIPGAHFVVLSEVVTVDDGTGLVHMDPAYGVDDFAIGRAYDLPVVNPIRGDGTFEEELPLVGGAFFKDADPAINADLRERGLMFHEETYEHSYPHCWRCHTPLIYYALPAWYIRTTQIKESLLGENERTNWYPETIKWGRYGEWLRNNVDWALSRSRYWGTPLPLWVCPDDHVTCVGSRAELSTLAGRDLADLDPHRPYVDEVVIPCPTCAGEARRVPDVIDAWYDSGSMPFAQWGAPHVHKDEFEANYPAQFICEGTDQTRGWFYSLMAVGTLVFGRSSYENVLCLGLILAEDGRKMSKHLGNVLEPIPLMDEHGADALRWFFACSGSPWAARRIGHGALEEIVRKVLLTYWNTASFFVLYANATPWTVADLPDAPPYGSRPLLDRWALSELHRTVSEVTSALDDFDSTSAGRRLAEFLDDLSNWYVRRSRRRFWTGDPAAFATLYECLTTVTRLLAPMVPFVTDYVWDVLRAPGDAPSVHLTSWPEVAEGLVDPVLSDRMALIRRLVELGRSARAASGMRTRQPLARALIGAAVWDEVPGELRDLLADELNVESLESLSGVATDLVSFSVKPNFRALGRRFGATTKQVAAAISAADPAELASTLRTAGGATVVVDGDPVPLGPEEVIVTEQPRSGWAVETGAIETGTGETVALDLALTPELRRAGMAREVIRLVQDARKSSGFEITDRVSVWWSTGDEELAAAMREHAGTISEEVLADTFTDSAAPADLAEFRDDDLDLVFRLRRSR